MPGGQCHTAHAVGPSTLIFYGGTLLVGFVPTAGVSWEGHLFGFVAGIVAAKLIVKNRSLPTLQPPEA